MTQIELPTSIGLPDTEAARGLIEEWLERFERVVAAHDDRAVDALFVDDCWWRDLLAMTWTFRTHHGVDAVRRIIGDHRRRSPGRLCIDERTEPRSVVEATGTAYIDALVTFVTDEGIGRGVLRLRQVGDGAWKAWTLTTVLQDLHGHEQARADRRPARLPGDGSGRTWRDWRDEVSAFEDTSPEVLIIGSGHNGLMTAAHLGAWGVPTLIVEQHARVGDNWRGRYRSLVLHDPVWVNHLTGMPFPDSTPVFMSKDYFGDWLEQYAIAMQLNVWTSTEIVSARYVDADARWEIVIRRSDGVERVLRPSDVVIATGVHGEPRIPVIPGAASFTGTVRHTSDFVGDEVGAGASAIIIGAGNSAHDAAQHLHGEGVDVTMVQRSSTHVSSQASNIRFMTGRLYHEQGMPFEVADFFAESFPNLLALERAVDLTRDMAEFDADLLDGLVEVGYNTDMGIDGGGALSKILSGPGSYYMDVGCGGLIVNGDVAVTHAGVERISERAVHFDDGTVADADLIVYGTGYQNIRETARRLLGDEAADRCTPVWQLDDEGEIAGIWRRGGHPGLWFHGGNIKTGRFYSRLLALQLHGLALGLIER